MTDASHRLFSEACERNKQPIAAVLAELIPEDAFVFEVGSGTGQHAAHFATSFPSVTWQPSDRGTDHASIRAWTADIPNVLTPLSFDLFDEAPPVDRADVVVCINAIHIAPWAATERLFQHASDLLEPGGIMFLYGPFRYRDRPLEPSNERFDGWLKQRDPASGIRTFEDVDALARAHGFALVDDRAMPANNRAIWWTRTN